MRNADPPSPSGLKCASGLKTCRECTSNSSKTRAARPQARPSRSRSGRKTISYSTRSRTRSAGIWMDWMASETSRIPAPCPASNGHSASTVNRPGALAQMLAPLAQLSSSSQMASRSVSTVRTTPKTKSTFVCATRWSTGASTRLMNCASTRGAVRFRSRIS